MVTLEEAKRAFIPKLRPLRWDRERHVLTILDQTLLPFEVYWVEAKDPSQIAEAIKSMRVRGAPAIGIAAAYGMVTALNSPTNDIKESLNALAKAKLQLDAARPTAVNLSWATSRMLSKANRLVHEGEAKKVDELKELLEEEANRVYEEELEAELKIGIYGFEKLNDGDVVLTQCNAGGLAQVRG